jgi:hypothetical protein
MKISREQFDAVFDRLQCGAGPDDEISCRIVLAASFLLMAKYGKEEDAWPNTPMHDLVVRLIAALTLAQRQALKSVAEDLHVPASERKDLERAQAGRHGALNSGQKIKLGLPGQQSPALEMTWNRCDECGRFIAL